MRKLSKVFKSIASIFVAIIVLATTSYMIDHFPKEAAYILLISLLIGIWAFLKLWEDFTDIESLEDNEYAFRAEEVYILFDSEDYDKFLEKCIAPLWGKDFIVIDKNGYQLSTDYCDDSLYPVTVYRLISKRTDEHENLIKSYK